MKIAMVATHPLTADGVSSYTRNLIYSLKQHNVQVTLFANNPKQNVENSKEIDVCWNRGIRYPWQIFRAIARYCPQIVHIQHEFFLFGGVISAALFPLLLILAKLLRKPIIVTLHGVISPSIVDKQFLYINGMKGNPLVFKIGAIFLVKLIAFFSDYIIVHERCFAKTLEAEYRCKKTKIHVIPHGVEENNQKLSPKKAKRELGLENKKLVLFFGYLAPYKGIDTLIEGFSLAAENHKDWILMVCGDVHPRLISNQEYKKYVLALRRSASSLASNQVIFTGFIPNDSIGLYFSAADLVVLPYKVAMASSGPLTLSLSYKTPILVSRIASFEQLLPLHEATFSKESPEDLAEKLKELLENPRIQQKVIDYLSDYAKNCYWSTVALRTVRVYESFCEVKIANQKMT